MSAYLLPIHLTILGVTALGILLADHEGMQWVSGKKPLLEWKKVFRLHLWVGFGLIGMLITGFLMFWPVRNYLLHNSLAFLIKMMFVAVLIGNSFLIGELTKISTKRTYASLSSAEKRPFFISGAVSTISWLGAATAALFLFS